MRLSGLTENLGDLLAIPGQVERLRSLVLDLAVSGRLLAESASAGDAVTYLSAIVEDCRDGKPAKKLKGLELLQNIPDAPEGWTPTLLGRISMDIRYGTSLKTSEYGDIPVLRMGNIRKQRLKFDNLKYLPLSADLDNLMLTDGDILFNRTNSAALVGKSAVFHGQGLFTYASYLIRVRLHPDVSPDFVNIWLGSPVGRAWAMRVKTDAIGQSNINGTSLGKFPLALPDQSEQMRIVERVEELLSLIESYEAQAGELDLRRRAAVRSGCNALVARRESLILDHAEDLINTSEDVNDVERAVFGLAVSGRLVSHYDGDEDGHSLVAKFAASQGKMDMPVAAGHQLIETPFTIPESWAWTTLGVAGKIIGGGTPRSGRDDCFAGEPSLGIPWFTPADLGGNSSMYVSTSRRSLTEIGLKVCSAQVLPAGSILFSSRAPIGYVAVLEKSASTNQGFKSLVPHGGLVSEFAYFWLRYWAPEIDATAPSVTFREVNKKNMERQPIPIPPTEEQHRIVERVTKLMSYIQSLRTRMAA